MIFHCIQIHPLMSMCVSMSVPVCASVCIFVCACADVFMHLYSIRDY